jgi:hypothetical protein
MLVITDKFNDGSSIFIILIKIGAIFNFCLNGSNNYWNKLHFHEY